MVNIFAIWRYDLVLVAWMWRVDRPTFDMLASGPLFLSYWAIVINAGHVLILDLPREEALGTY